MFQSPFKFLDSYTREDRKIFFGHDRETQGFYRGGRSIIYRVPKERYVTASGLPGASKPTNSIEFRRNDMYHIPAK